MNSNRLQTRSYQTGVVSIVVAIILFAVVIFWLQQTYGIISTTSQTNQVQDESVAAFFLAESGLERAKGLLRAAPDPTARSVCETDIRGTSSLGGGRFTLTGSATGCDTATPPANCTSCTIRSTGNMGTAERTIESVISLTAPDGAAIGCGGGNISPVTCPVPGVAESRKWPDIAQRIEVTSPPVILVSNMAFLRHPQAATNDIDAAGCVTEPPSGPCLTKWNIESNSSAGVSVIGGRGAAIEITKANTYTLTQNLTGNSLFAAVGARFGGAPSIVGSYWDDDTTGSGVSTVEQGNGAVGQTNNGAACTTPGTPDNVTCPPLDIPPDTATYNSLQKSRSWCHDADTLVLGFSGSGSPSGTITSFTFGSSPASLEVPNGLVRFVNPGTQPSDKSIYAAMRYIHNKYYLSATDAVSGARVTGWGGAARFNATLYKSKTYLEVTSIIGGTIPNGGTLQSTHLSDNQTISYCTGNHSVLGTPCGSGGVGAYNISVKPSNPPTDPYSEEVGIKSTTLTVTGDEKPYLEANDTLYGTGITVNTTISSLDSGMGGNGTYTLSSSQTFAATTITSNGTTVSTTSSTPSTGPVVDTVVGVRSGTGQLTSGTVVAATSTPPSGTLFKLSARPTTPLSAAQLCGGICAFFNHSSISAKTNFSVGVANTGDWAAGFLCLKGIDTGTIAGLSGTGAAVAATSWHEVVR